jgi:hypothetical protein
MKQKLEKLWEMLWCVLGLLFCVGVVISPNPDTIPRLVHGVLLPFELLHLLYMAARGEFGPFVCFWTWAGLVMVPLWLLPEGISLKKDTDKKV